MVRKGEATLLCGTKFPRPLFQRGLGAFGKRLQWKQVVARDAILSVMKAPVGVASSHDHRGKMPLPQKKRPTLLEGNDMRDHYYPSAFSLQSSA
jgi:hypothetical protein